MRRSKPVTDAGKQLRDLSPAGRGRLHPVGQRPAVDELGHKVRMALGFADLVDSQDVRMIQCRGVDRFFLEAAASRRPGNLTRKNLDGDWTLEPGVAGAVHAAHPARSKLGIDDIRPESIARRGAH